MSIEAVRIKALANLENAKAIKLSYFDKSPPWLVSAIMDNDASLHNGLIYVVGNTKPAAPGDYLVKVSGGIEIKTHDEIKGL